MNFLSDNAYFMAHSFEWMKSRQIYRFQENYLWVFSILPKPYVRYSYQSRFCRAQNNMVIICGGLEPCMVSRLGFV